jgi:uncharacterized delta-60 repeat protein
MRRWLVVAVVTVAALTGAGRALGAAPGDPDPTFGTGGVATLAAGSTFVPAVQPDGKILVGTDSLSLIRLNADGSPDASFGHAGSASLSSAPPGGSCTAVLVQSDGKVLVAGDLNSEFALARYLADGTLDPSFGADTGHPGYVMTDVSSIVSAPLPGHASSGIQSIALEPDGSIVALGSALEAGGGGPASPSEWLVRYTPSGALDTSFGSSGTGVVSVGPALGAQLALTGDGTIAVVSSPTPGVAESRYSSSGAPGGFATTTSADGFLTTSLIATAGGSLTVAAQVIPSYTFGSPVPPAVVGLIRFNADGTPDSAFGSDAIVISPVPAGGPVSEAGASNGSIVVGSGTTLARFTTTGALDASFGAGGEETVATGEPNTAITGVGVAPDGGILAVGYEGNAPHGWVARYLATGTPRRYDVSVSRGGTGRGTVSDASAGIDCGSTCAGTIAADSSTTFTERPAAGSAFAGWSVPACGIRTTCTVTSQPGNDHVVVSAQFRRLAPNATRGPSIAGTGRVGGRLTVRRGTWVGDAITFRYQWQRCAPHCRAVKHATRATYRVGATDRGHRLRVTVTAANSAGHAMRTSGEVGPIAAGAAELRTLLHSALAHHPSLRALSRVDAYRYTIRTLGPGTITIAWRAGRARLGSVTVRFTRARRITPRLALTRAGRSLVAGRRIPSNHCDRTLHTSRRARQHTHGPSQPTR